MNEQHLLNHPDVPRMLRYAGIILLIALLLAEAVLGLPGTFGLHAAIALLSSLLLALFGLAAGRVFDMAQSALIDD